MPLLPAIFLKSAFAASSAAALWFALLAEAPVEHMMLFHLRGDHLLHALTFAYLTTLGMLLWSPAWLVGCLMFLAGGVLELLQMPFGRDAEFSDWMASSAGVVLGSFLFLGLWFCCAGLIAEDESGTTGEGRGF